MYYKYRNIKETVFYLREDESDKLSTSLNVSDIERSLDEEFMAESMNNYAKRANREFNMAEKRLLSSLVICDVVNLFDSLIFPSHMVDKPREILKLFDTISGERLFKNNINYIYYHSKANIYPFWFQPNKAATIAEWIVANFESHIVQW